jgi:hypothetical protein
LTIVPEQEGEFTGVFISHWEASGIQVEVGRWLFGLIPRKETWRLNGLPENFAEQYLQRKFMTCRSTSGSDSSVRPAKSTAQP